ncbi:hypothetical protein C900_00390 [Fulvivirga imtechensis AK7]|uniref:DUF4097 domain-containing protein n=1 Tax=Fulvivirga imtechensis AK7 TaxID=1237149 RepID=L8JM06_9BACT|nr:DUF4097 family beta strand repeat-containing protein [Fulvivirga imtechensis]ELR68422.1 hypothetical protein C900_00390 [Fulvivirga imtechensis AK7]
MKKTALTLAAMLMLVCANLGLGQDSGELTVPFSEPSKRGKVRIDIKKGSIEVRGTERKDVLISYVGRSERKNDSERTKDGLRRISGAAMDLEISEKNNYVDIESDSWNSGVNLKVEVPRNVDLHVETYNDGNLYISNVSGEIVADNYNGKIAAENISGSLVANTYNGSIKVTFDKITPDTPMAFTTYNGDVDLTLPENFKASLKMKTARGEIYSAFDFTIKKNEPVTKTEKKSGTYKVYLDDWVRGEVNGGGPEFMIKNYNGDIYLRKK